MTEMTETTSTSSADQDGGKIRGRIPRQAWAYVRGLYELLGMTYEQIGDMYNSTPSAVFYVVQQARKNEIEPTTEAPTAEMLQMRVKRPRRRNKDSLAWARAAVSQAALSEQANAQANAILEDPNAKRVFDTTSKLLLDFAAWKDGAAGDVEARLKESIREALRSISKIEIMIATQPKPAVTHSPAVAEEVA